MHVVPSLEWFWHSCVPEQALCVVLHLKTLLIRYQDGAQALYQPSGFPRAGEPWHCCQTPRDMGNAHCSHGGDPANLLLLRDALISWINGWLKPCPALLEAEPVALLRRCPGWNKAPPAALREAPAWSVLWRCHVPKCQQGNEQWFFWLYKDSSACTASYHSRTGQMIDRAGGKSYFLLKLTRPENAHVAPASLVVPAPQIKISFLTVGFEQPLKGITRCKKIKVLHSFHLLGKLLEQRTSPLL